MREWELTEGEIARAIKDSRKDINRTYARYRAVASRAQSKLLDYLMQKEIVNPKQIKASFRYPVGQ